MGKPRLDRPRPNALDLPAKPPRRRRGRTTQPPLVVVLRRPCPFPPHRAPPRQPHQPLSAPPCSMPPSDQILRLHHRRRRCTLLVWALVAALFAGLASGASLLGWWTQAHLAGLACAALAVVCLAVWFVRARRLTREALARRLDAEWQLSARLESSEEVAADSSAFARALRDDASRHLATRRLPAAPWWHGGLALLMLALLAGVVEISILGWRLLAAPAVEQPAELPEDITATIDWITPHSEIKATAIEEIPLAATTTTATGFRSVTLEISINGAPTLSRPLDLEALAKPGTHPIQLPFYP